MLNRSDKNGYFCLVPDLRGKAIKYDASFRDFVHTLFGLISLLFLVF